MRIVFLYAFLLVSISLTAQSNFQKQIGNIIADSANNFRKFRGQPKLFKEDSDSVFISTIQIEGTKDNEIYRLDTLGWSYSALIADSVKTNKGEKICNEWKGKIEMILGARFVIKKHEIKNYNPGNYGWRFSNKNLIIRIIMMPISKGEINRIWLFFEN